NGVSVWLVSADSVPRIPQLTTVVRESDFEKKLPQFLVTTTFIGTPLWIWFALVLAALILSLLSRLLSRIFIALVTPFWKRYTKSNQTYRLEAFAEPLRLLLSIAVFRVFMEAIAPSAIARDYLLKLLALLFILGAASFLMRVVDVISDRAVSRLDPRQRAVSYSVFPLFVRIIKIFILCIAILFVLSQWGYSTSTILAGVGVGGIAVALAAQKTIENLFGSFSVITDRPVLVGDFCQFGNQTGTVEDIGLRSTRIRTLDRTVVTIPNSVFSTMTLENYSRRDRFWFHPTLHLRRDTTPGQIREMADAITKILQEHRQVNAAGYPVRFTTIGNQSFDLEIFAYILTTDGDEYLKIQADLLLKMLETAERLSVGFAVPLQESIAPPARDSESEPVGAYDSGRASR
ncbi:MAG: mechanosensitive ion channel family protein, partial [Acidobacteriaceae bacterium]|nr:mechanosensitive ion channel family protein [Acidobacteriaceae bacterium]